MVLVWSTHTGLSRAQPAVTLLFSHALTGHYEFTSISLLCFLKNISLIIPGNPALCGMLRTKQTRGAVALLQGWKFLHILVPLSAFQWGRNENKRQSKECFCSAASLSYHRPAKARCWLPLPNPGGCRTHPQVAWLPPVTLYHRLWGSDRVKFQTYSCVIVHIVLSWSLSRMYFYNRPL